jgi:Xaa-Pro aminopeptidase
MDWLPILQAELRRGGLEGWLLYDFRGNNPVARQFLTLNGILSRRIFLFVPSEGRPTLLVHAIERGSLPELSFEVASYSSRQSLETELGRILPRGRVAMEYSRDIPYVSHVDGGTVDLVRGLGAEVVSSAELLQTFAAWTPAQLAAHREAARHVMAAKDVGFSFIAERGPGVRETEVQRAITDYFDRHGVVYDHPPIVGFARHAGDPHYVPRSGQDAELKPGDVILIDLWAKRPEETAPYADVTWMGVWGTVAPEVQKVWTIVRDARDLAVETIRQAYREGRYPPGCEIDRATRDFIHEQGYGEAFLHRTGHSLGTVTTHGSAAHLDNFETRDTRTLRPGLGVTVEPGIYLPHFGVRSELNLYLGEDGPEVTTDAQGRLEVLG